MEGIQCNQLTTKWLVGLLRAAVFSSIRLVFWQRQKLGQPWLVEANSMRLMQELIPTTTATLPMHPGCQHQGGPYQRLADANWQILCLIGHLCPLCDKCSLLGVSTRLSFSTLYDHTHRSVHLSTLQTSSCPVFEAFSQCSSSKAKPYNMAHDSIYILFFFLIYLFLAVLGLRVCARAFSSCGK